jgi:hypothetical protein
MLPAVVHLQDAGTGARLDLHGRQHTKSIFPIIQPMAFENSVKEYLMRCADVGNHHVNTKYTVMQMMVEARASDGKTALLSHGKLRDSGKCIEDSSRAKSLETLLRQWDLPDYPIWQGGGR